MPFDLWAYRGRCCGCALSGCGGRLPGAGARVMRADISLTVVQVAMASRCLAQTRAHSPLTRWRRHRAIEERANTHSSIEPWGALHRQLATHLRWASGLQIRAPRCVATQRPWRASSEPYSEFLPARARAPSRGGSGCARHLECQLPFLCAIIVGGPNVWQGRRGNGGSLNIEVGDIFLKTHTRERLKVKSRVAISASQA